MRYHQASAAHRSHAQSNAKFFRSLSRRSLLPSRVSTYGIVSSSSLLTARAVSTTMHPCESKDWRQLGAQL